ncbi:hypothetical protein [Nocardia sp. NPDC005998]|uniref:hypothetical protein n=1 Tax=Nocardia sp. NPDC005998 TaxID=3156894 RepID=UPI0033A57D3B
MTGNSASRNDSVGGGGRATGGNDPDYISSMEHFESMKHEEIYAKTQQIDAAQILNASVTWLEVAGTLASSFPLTRASSDRVMNTMAWEGAAAEAAYASARSYADSVDELAAIMGQVGTRLGAVAAAAEAVKIAVVPPGNSGPIGTIARLLEAVNVINAQMADEALRQEAVLAMNMIYKPAYQMAGTAIPALPAPPALPGTPGPAPSVPRHSQPYAVPDDQAPAPTPQPTPPGRQIPEPTPSTPESQPPQPTPAPTPSTPESEAPHPTPAPSTPAPTTPTPESPAPQPTPAPTTPQPTPAPQPTPPTPESQAPQPTPAPTTPQPAPSPEPTPIPAPQTSTPEPAPPQAPPQPSPDPTPPPTTQHTPPPTPEPQTPTPPTQQAPPPTPAPQPPAPVPGPTGPTAPLPDPGGQPGITGPIPEDSGQSQPPSTTNQPGVIPTPDATR